MPEPTRRQFRRVAAVAVAVVVLAGAPGCGRDRGPAAVRARLTPGHGERSQLSGSWPVPTTTTTTTTTTTSTTPAPTTTTPAPTTTTPAPTTTTTAPTTTTTAPTTTTTAVAPANLDRTTGLGVTGPMGPPWPTAFLAAWAKVPAVALFESPGVAVPTGRTLPHPTVEGVPLVMLVRKEQGEWLQVQINARPNGATAWIKRSDVTLRSVPNHVVIDLGARRVTVFHGDAPIWSASVAPGKAESPTPTGSFYVDVLAKPATPYGPYGAYQISFTGFSTVYESFGGGNGQVAMHGTNRPELIGQPASHGCVRMTNADITHLLLLAPQGTPVDVVA